jgi:peroxiredoxin
MLWKIRIPIVLLFFLFSCKQSQEPENKEFIVRGEFTNAGSGMILLHELTTSEAVPLDSVMTDVNGLFSFRRPIDHAGFYIIKVNDENQLTLLIEPGEHIFIKGDAQQLVSSYIVEGSEGSSLLASLNKKLWYNRQRVDSLVKHYRAHKYEPGVEELRKELEQDYTLIFQEQQAFVKSFIENNPQSLASVIALYQYFGRRLLLKEDEHFEYFESLSKSLAEVYPLNRHVMDLKRRVSEHKRNEAQRRLVEQSLSPGSAAPEILLPDPDGNQVSLSSLRGKIVLIDFWAAWCPPCRKSNEKLKQIYDEFNTRGFEIYAVSLDRTLDQWVLGIEEDQIDWIQVSDLRFWNSPVVSLYNVESIPHTVLIDRDGNIVKKGVDPDELRGMLSQMIQ